MVVNFLSLLRIVKLVFLDLKDKLKYERVALLELMFSKIEKGWQEVSN